MQEPGAATEVWELLALMERCPMRVHRFGTLLIHVAAVAVGLVVIVLGLGLGVTMIMLPVGVVVGLMGVAMVVAGLFGRAEQAYARH
jgi:hypothetical protein